MKPRASSNPGPRILVVEDERAMRIALEDALTAEGYRVLTAADGAAGLDRALQEKPDLILLDIMLPRLDGFALCAELRRLSHPVPVLMLTAKSQIEDRVTGLDAGADDYLVKPFSTRELLARVRALLRRARQPGKAVRHLTLGPVRIDLARQTAMRGRTAIHLTAREFAMLRLLAEADGEPVTREHFLDVVSEALQQGLLAEEVRQDLDAAIASYQSVVDQHDAQRRWVATALFRLGESYRKQGKTAEAIAQYRRLLAEFSDQTKVAQLSRRQLEALAPGSAIRSPLTPAVQRQKELLAEELQLVEHQVKEMQARIDRGRAAPVDLIPFQREAFSLQRQMAALDATVLLDLAVDPTVESIAGAQPFTPHGSLSEEEQRELDRLMELVRNSPDLINSSTRGGPPLHAAAQKGQLVVARFLIENGADLELGGGSSATPLHRAVESGHKAMTEMLLAAGAQVDASGNVGRQPLHLAALRGFTEIIKVLLAAGADVNAAAGGGTPLHDAIAGRIAVIDLLLDSGADLEAKTPVHFKPAPGYTPLMLAVGNDLTLMVAHLLKRGADVNATNAAGDHVLHVAVQSSRPDAILRARSKPASSRVNRGNPAGGSNGVQGNGRNRGRK